MGRYTTVQAYSNDDSKLGKIKYKKAKGLERKKTDGTSKKSDGLKTEKVVNPSGSGAGAGSGEFHTYRANRRREEDRLKRMNLEHEKKVRDEAFRERVERKRRECEERTAKKRLKRQKRRKRRKHARLEADLEKLSAGKKKTREDKKRGRDEASDDATSAKRAKDGTDEARVDGDLGETTISTSAPPPSNKNIFRNDGSFMDLFSSVA